VERHFGRWLRREIGKLGLSVTDFAAQKRLPRPSLNEWLKKESPGILPKNIKALADALGKTYEEVEAQMPSTAPVIAAVSASSLSQESQGVDGMFAHTNAGENRSWISIRGDCMLPEYQDGDRVLVDYEEWRRDGFRPGKDYAIALQNGSGETTFKRVGSVRGNTLTLICVNDAFPPISVRLSDVINAGKAVSLQRSV
jgi:SOS-response transcriptional repressor LexA